MKRSMFIVMTGLGSLAAGCSPKSPPTSTSSSVAECPSTVLESTPCVVEGQECPGPKEEGCPEPLLTCEQGQWNLAIPILCNPPPVEIAKPKPIPCPTDIQADAPCTVEGQICDDPTPPKGCPPPAYA